VSPVLDVLGAEVAIPDPDAIAGLASHYLQVRDQIGEVRSQLQGADNDTAWQGEAADAFRQDLGALPSELTKAYTSYGDMAQAPCPGMPMRSETGSASTGASPNRRTTSATSWSRPKVRSTRRAQAARTPRASRGGSPPSSAS
jgi:hypothetical protein